MAAQDVVTSYRALSPAEQEEVKRAMLPHPTGNALSVVWLMIIGTLSLVVLGGGVLVYLLVQDDKTTDVFVGFVSAALGALIGLLAPSPVANPPAGG